MRSVVVGSGIGNCRTRLIPTTFVALPPFPCVFVCICVLPFTNTPPPAPPFTFSQKKHRGHSLLDLHGQSIERSKKDGKDGPPPIWDRDLHMSVGGKLMDDKDRKAQILDAKGLGSRFGHAKGGAYS